MRPFMFMPLLIACGCVGPGNPVTDQNTDARQVYCFTNQKKIERNGIAGVPCRLQPGVLEQVGNALSGTASAFRAPGP